MGPAPSICLTLFEPINTFYAILNSINLNRVLQDENHRSELDHQKSFPNQVLNTDAIPE